MIPSYGFSELWWLVFLRCVWCSVGAGEVNVDARVPLERALGSVSPYTHYVPFQSTKWELLFPVIYTGHHSVFAWKVRLCFSCTWGFGVVAGKQGWFAPLTGEGGASQERTSGQACCSVSVQRTWWCLASILLLLKLHVRGVLADVYKIPFHMFLKTTLTWEAPLLFF